ncbi:MAG: hypothetical protein HQL22_12150, partial [Candidatus Omnitrophica bacterium]|nr:hypothetical protein [Candidatus Omnitrophota bacterium]
NIEKKNILLGEQPNPDAEKQIKQRRKVMQIKQALKQMMLQQLQINKLSRLIFRNQRGVVAQSRKPINDPGEKNTPVIQKILLENI